MVLFGSSTATKSLGLGRPSSFFPKDAWPASFLVHATSTFYGSWDRFFPCCGAHRHVNDLIRHHWSSAPLKTSIKTSFEKTYGLEYVFQFQKDSLLVTTCVYQREKTCFIFSPLSIRGTSTAKYTTPFPCIGLSEGDAKLCTNLGVCEGKNHKYLKPRWSTKPSNLCWQFCFFQEKSTCFIWWCK